MSLTPTASQTAGPYVEIGTTWNANGLLVGADSEGAMTLSGTVLDSRGEPVTDAMLEFFQVDPSGRFASGEGWRGFGRSLTLNAGRYSLTTLKPGPVRQDEAVEAPHISVSVFCRGLLQRLVTHIYFDDEQAANGADPCFSRLDPERQRRLLARSEPGGYRFDIVLRGEEETPFFVP